MRQVSVIVKHGEIDDPDMQKIVPYLDPESDNPELRLYLAISAFYGAVHWSHPHWVEDSIASADPRA